MTEPEIDLPEWCEPFFAPARYKVAHGGRGSGKSWAFARMILIMSLHKRIRILCARELQNSIQESVHQLLVDQIHALGLTGAFQIFESKIISATGSDFIFKGLRGMKNNAQSIKSLEGVDICWIEEGQTISAASFQTLTPTIRKPGAEIWVTLNPDSDADAVYQLVKNPPDGSIVRKVNWDDNPWFAQTSLPAEREWMLATDPDAYAHVWGGECRKNSAAQVLRGKYSVRSFEVAHDWDGPYQGADWGFSTDPSAFVRCWIGGRTLYIEAEAYAVGVEIDALPALFDGVSPQARKTTTRADNSRPETISYMQRHGYSRLIAADKWPGSVEDGVAFLRSFEDIVIHPSCKHTAEEARLYSYKTDRHTGDVLTALADKHNHIWDACIEKGQLVRAMRGDVPIEQIVVGDMVWTRQGWKAVLAHRMTHASARIFEVKTDTGHLLRATADHLVFVNKKGFVRVDALSCDDCLIVINQGSLLTNTLAPSLVRASVVQVCETADLNPVYDISVQDAEEFFASGILVHNCRYALAPLIRKRTAGISTMNVKGL